MAFTFSPYCMVLVKSSGKSGVFWVWQLGQVMVIWLCFVSWVCICMSILYRVFVVVPLCCVRFVWQCLHVVGLCSTVWSGCFSIFSPCPLWFFCAPGGLFVFCRWVWGFFHGGFVEGGLWLFLLFWFIWVCRVWICFVRVFSSMVICCFSFWFSVANALFSAFNCLFSSIKSLFCFGIPYLCCILLYLSLFVLLCVLLDVVVGWIVCIGCKIVCGL